jgi:hypothetical protein
MLRTILVSLVCGLQQQLLLQRGAAAYTVVIPPEFISAGDQPPIRFKCPSLFGTISVDSATYGTQRPAPRLGFNVVSACFVANRFCIVCFCTGAQLFGCLTTQNRGFRIPARAGGPGQSPRALLGHPTPRCPPTTC